MFAFGLQNVCAQDGIKIVTNHPDFKVKVKRCAASGKIVVIDFVLENIGTKDVAVDNILVYNLISEAYDDEGNIYQDKNLRIKVANRAYGNATGGFNIPTDVPMKVSLQITDVPISAERIARLSLGVRCDAWGLKYGEPIRISNIPISRQ